MDYQSLLAALKHLPGQHNQADHGRGRNGSTSKSDKGITSNSQLDESGGWKRNATDGIYIRDLVFDKSGNTYDVVQQVYLLGGPNTVGGQKIIASVDVLNENVHRAATFNTNEQGKAKKWAKQNGQELIKALEGSKSGYQWSGMSHGPGSSSMAARQVGQAAQRGEMSGSQANEALGIRR